MPGVDEFSSSTKTYKKFVASLGQNYHPSPHVPHHGKPHKFSDTSHWIYCCEEYGLGLSSLMPYIVGDDTGTISEIQTFDVPSNLASSDNKYLQLGLTPEGNLLESVRPYSWTATTATCTLIEYVPGLPTPLHIYPVKVPIPNTLKAPTYETSLPPCLSPDGTKIAWLLPYSATRADSKFMAFLREHHVLQPLPNFAVWVSDRTGSNMRLISKQTADLSALSDLDWTPDGKYVTYQEQEMAVSHQTYNALLCKIPVSP